MLGFCAHPGNAKSQIMGTSHEALWLRGRGHAALWQRRECWACTTACCQRCCGTFRTSPSSLRCMSACARLWSVAALSQSCAPGSTSSSAASPVRSLIPCHEKSHNFPAPPVKAYFELCTSALSCMGCTPDSRNVASGIYGKFPNLSLACLYWHICWHQV